MLVKDKKFHLDSRIKFNLFYIIVTTVYNDQFVRMTIVIIMCKIFEPSRLPCRVSISWSQEPKPGIKAEYSDVGTDVLTGVLTTRLNVLSWEVVSFFSINIHYLQFINQLLNPKTFFCNCIFHDSKFKDTLEVL